MKRMVVAALAEALRSDRARTWVMYDDGGCWWVSLDCSHGPNCMPAEVVIGADHVEIRLSLWRSDGEPIVLARTRVGCDQPDWVGNVFRAVNRYEQARDVLIDEDWLGPHGPTVANPPPLDLPLNLIPSNSGGLA